MTIRVGARKNFDLEAVVVVQLRQQRSIQKLALPIGGDS